MASLRELQLAFAAALHEPETACPVLPHRNLSIYRNNSAHVFRSALESGFPVVRKRVGDDYFRQLGTLYRAKYPSRSGDLHWVGRHFSAFLLEHLHGTDYAWLADLARLEWSREQAGISNLEPAVTADVLAAVAPDQLEHLIFRLQPSLALIASDFPVFTIFVANQAENASPVDQSVGPESGMVLLRTDGIHVRKLPSGLFSYISALAAGAPLGEAVTMAGLDQAALVRALGFVFTERLVCSVTAKRETET